jgi:tetratricopeptide (TPR) repeat protein
MAISSNNIERLILAGKVAAERGDNAEAEKIFLQVLAREPKHLDAHVNLGFVLLRARREHEAYSFFKAALLEIDPDSTDAMRGFDIAAKGEIKASGDPKKVFRDRMDLYIAKLRKDVANGDKATNDVVDFIRGMGGKL